jgi:hypothetical protein
MVEESIENSSKISCDERSEFSFFRVYLGDDRWVLSYET